MGANAARGPCLATTRRGAGARGANAAPCERLQRLAEPCRSPLLPRKVIIPRSFKAIDGLGRDRNRHDSAVSLRGPGDAGR